MKIKLLLQSLSPLFLFTFVQNVDVQVWGECGLIGYKDILLNNVIAIIFLALIIMSLCFYMSFNRFKTKGLELPETIEKIENINENNLIFFVTYILPLTVMDLSTLRSIILFILILFFIVVLLLKTNLYYANPILIIAGYSIYKISTKQKNNVIIMLKDKEGLQKGSKVHLKPITDKLIYFAKRA